MLLLPLENSNNPLLIPKVEKPPLEEGNKVGRELLVKRGGGEPGDSEVSLEDSDTVVLLESLVRKPIVEKPSRVVELLSGEVVDPKGASLLEDLDLSKEVGDGLVLGGVEVLAIHLLPR